MQFVGNCLLFSKKYKESQLNEMETLTPESALHHCRTCLQNLEAKMQIDADYDAAPGVWHHLQHTAELKNWIQLLAPIQTLDADHYPQFVCVECYEKLKKFTEFHDLVRNGAMVLDALFGETITLRQHQQQAIPIKIELAEQKPEHYSETEFKRDRFEYINTAAEGEEGGDDDDYERQDNNAEYMIKFEPADDTEYITPTNLCHVDGADSNDASDAEIDQPKVVKQYKCAECGRKYAHKYTYIAHIRQDHLGIARAFECDKCHKKFTKFCNLYRHMRLEHDEQLRQFKCEYDNCKRSFRQLQTRRKHYEEFHKRPRKPTVDPNLTMLQAERKAVAAKVLPQSSASTTETVIAAAAATQRRFICPLCPGEHFEMLYTLQLHMKTHASEMKYVCELCGKPKISQAKLNQHMATVHDCALNIPCPVCGKFFKNKSHVSIHVSSVHKRLRPFACSYCPSTFGARNTLKLHVRTHTGEKPFACDICGRRFTQLSPMKKHMQTHQKGRRNALPAEAAMV